MDHVFQFLEDRKTITQFGNWEQPNADLMRWRGGPDILALLDTGEVTLTSEARYDERGLYCGRGLEMTIGGKVADFSVAVAFAEKLQHQSKWIQ
jgi:hypothetical protein